MTGRFHHDTRSGFLGADADLAGRRHRLALRTDWCLWRIRHSADPLPAVRPRGLAGVRAAAAMTSDTQSGMLTEHFSLAEFVTSDTAAMSGIDNTPDADEVEQLAETAELMELVRALCGGSPVYITSGY